MNKTHPTVVCLVDGEPASGVEATDSSVLRGDGCFEAIRSYRGHLFRLEDHLDRLERSAAALDLHVPPRETLRSWLATVTAGRGDCAVRIVLTRGPAVPGVAGDGRCVVLSHPLPPLKSTVTLLPVPAPWHPAGRAWELAGVKTISYAPNQAASRIAGKQGFDDALLVADDGVVLEGPTFSVGWCRDGRVMTPSLELGILASVTRRVVMELAAIEEVVAGLDALLQAEEVFVMSTLKEVTPVTRVGERAFAVGPLTAELSQRVAVLVDDSVVAH